MRDQHSGINMLKGIACIIVVFLHIPFPGVLGKLIAFSLNFSVPVFFMISGFFSYKKDNDLWCRRKSFQLLKIILVTEFLYGIWIFVVECVIGSGTFGAFLAENAVLKHPVRVFICGTMYNGTLWYVYAAMWTLMIYSILIRHNLLKNSNLYWIVFPLLFIQVFGKLYWMNHYDISSSIFLFRNFVVFGLPMTLIGSWIAKNQEELQTMFSSGKAIAVVIGGGILSIVEYIAAHKLLKVSGMDFHISTVLVSVGLFLFALNFPVIKANPILYIGEKLYIWVYLSHIFVGSFLDETAKFAGVNRSPLYLWFRPILALALACLIAGWINRIKARVKKKRGVSI